MLSQFRLFFSFNIMETSASLEIPAEDQIQISVQQGSAIASPDVTLSVPLEVKQSFVSMCRICFDTKEVSGHRGKLLKACKCSGSIGLCHERCLMRWLRTSSHTKCELCHYPIRLQDKGMKRFYHWSFSDIELKQQILSQQSMKVFFHIGLFFMVVLGIGFIWFSPMQEAVAYRVSKAYLPVSTVLALLGLLLGFIIFAEVRNYLLPIASQVYLSNRNISVIPFCEKLEKGCQTEAELDFSMIPANLMKDNDNSCAGSDLTTNPKFKGIKKWLRDRGDLLDVGLKQVSRCSGFCNRGKISHRLGENADDLHEQLISRGE